jgi:hypothetical protein
MRTLVNVEVARKSSTAIRFNRNLAQVIGVCP